MQTDQHGFREHERTRRQSMSGQTSALAHNPAEGPARQDSMRYAGVALRHVGQPLERFNTGLFDGNFIGFLRQTQIEMIEFSPSHADSKMVGDTSFHGCGRARRIRQSNDFGWCERT